jgi:hypothetical protein
MMQAMQVRKGKRELGPGLERKRVPGYVMVLGMCFAMIAILALAPGANAMQDPQDGGPRVNPAPPAYSQNGPQDEGRSDDQDPNGYPQQTDRQSADQQPSYSQNGGPSQHDDAQFPAAKSEVARISLLHGEISMQRGDTGDWSTATLNTPLVRGDQVATGDKSRAEIQLDYADILRLSARSQAKIADLTRTRIQLQIAQGYASYSMFKGGEADVEIDTPNVSVRPLRKGRYRVQVNSDSETEVIVREGEAEVTTPQGSTTVKQGQAITIRGTSNPEYRVDSAPPKDDWDRFNKDRDNEIRDAASWRRTNPYYTGANDLDGHGRWVFIPGYGWVWQPYQDTGWAPYQAGRWVYEPYWGWTWVSSEPWGWAPYHYGRWFFWGASWVWWPGPVYSYYRPIWAPAYVSFIGFGHGFGVGFGFGSIGWLPCGPFDYFYPWYGRGFNRVNVVNITNINVINVRNDFRVRPLGIRGRQPFVSNVNLALTNPRVRAGISGVPAGEFGRGNVQVTRLNVREADLRESRVVTGNVPVVPTRESLHAGAESRLGEGGLQPRNTDRFFARKQPPAAAPAFHEQVSPVQRVMQGHIGNAQIPSAGNRGPEATRAGEFHSQGNSGTATPGRDTAGQSASARAQDNTAESKTSGDQNHGGWTKFSSRSNSPSTSPSTTMSDSRRSGTSGSTGRSGASGPASRGNVNIPRNDGNPNGRSSSGPGASTSAPSNEDRGGFRRFPGDGGAAPSESTPRGESPKASGPVDRERGDRGVDRNNSGWQRFPSNSGPGSREDDGRQNDNPGGRDRSSSPRSKPILELNKPIVTPRGTPGPSPSRGPDMRNERSGPPSGSRSSEPRGGGSYGGGHERGGGGGGHERGGGGGGGERGSKSGSNLRNR